MAKIFFVEDDSGIAASVIDFLTRDGHVVEHVGDGTEAKDRLRLYEYDLIILDWQLPGASGLEICQTYRAVGGQKPILMMTGKQATADKVAGLDTGADDYLTKPFEFAEFGSRVRALLRRQNTTVSMVLTVQDIELNPSDHSVKRGGKTIDLTPREFAILEFLIKHRDQVVSPEMILNGVWHSESESTIDSIYTLVKNIRKKIGDKQSVIKTVHGIGYKLLS